MLYNLCKLCFPGHPRLLPLPSIQILSLDPPYSDHYLEGSIREKTSRRDNTIIQAKAAEVGKQPIEVDEREIRRSPFVDRHVV